jgi:hypothetical protein
VYSAFARAEISDTDTKLVIHNNSVEILTAEGRETFRFNDAVNEGADTITYFQDCVDVIEKFNTCGTNPVPDIT